MNASGLNTLVRRPRLLLLDDATSAVDPSIEAAILGRLAEAGSASTVVLVANRPVSIASCDEVLLLDAGRIGDRGTHAELLTRSAPYRQLLQAYERDRADREAD